MALPQADILTDIYMRPPQVLNSFKIPDLPSFAAAKDAKFSSVWQIKAKLKLVPLSIHDLIEKGVPLPQPAITSIAPSEDLRLAFNVTWNAANTSTPPA